MRATDDHLFLDYAYVEPDTWGDAVWIAGPNQCDTRANRTGQTHHPFDTTTLEPGQCAVLPGFYGEWAVIRWRAPDAGVVVFETAFAGVSGYNGARASLAEVAIVRGSELLFDEWLNLNGRGNTATVTLPQQLVAAGDSFDFKVGYGTSGPSTGGPPYPGHDLTAVRIVATLEQPLPARRQSWAALRSRYR